MKQYWKLWGDEVKFMVEARTVMWGGPLWGFGGSCKAGWNHSVVGLCWYTSHFHHFWKPAQLVNYNMHVGVACVGPQWISKVYPNICWWFCWYKWRSPLHTCGRLCFSLFDLVQPCSTLFNPVRPCTSLFDLVCLQTMSDPVQLSRSNLWVNGS